VKKILALLLILAFLIVPAASLAAEDDIVDIATGDEQFSILVQALQKAGLVETLQGEGPFTVFAPTNQAFESLLNELDITAKELLEREDLKDILLYHVVSGKVMSSDLEDGMMPETLQGSTLAIDLSDGVMINESMVTTADIEASNGVIHVIDKVLLPESDDAAAEDIPKTGSVVMLPFIGLAAISGFGIIAIKKKNK